MALTLPTQHRAGDTFSLTLSTSDYPAPAWTMTLIILNASQRYEIIGVASGEDHLFSASAAETALWTSGNYLMMPQATEGAVRVTLESADFEILPDVTVATDTRGHVQIMLDAIEAYLERKATTEQLDMIEANFNGRSIKQITLGELLTVRDKYRAELSSIKAAERVEKGLGTRRTIHTRFID